MGNHTELYKVYSQKQERYTYYIVALSIACIGYAVHQTTGLGYSRSQVLLGMAVLFWAISAYLGLRHSQLATSTVYTNMGLLKIGAGQDEIAGTDPQRIRIGQSTVTGIIKDYQKKASRVSVWQNRLFYVALILYLLWHLYEMYCNTI